VGLVAVEDTHMASGGRVWPGEAMDAVAATAAERDIPIHLDGARLWNAVVASGRTMAERARAATTVMSCLSKGLGAPVGSVLAGPAPLIEDAWIHRKRLGGSMRQAGVLAAAGLVGIRHMDHLAEDHEKATRLAEAVAERWPDIGMDPKAVHTNIVAFSPPDAPGLIEHLAGDGVLALTVGPGRVRLVTHQDAHDAGIEMACRSIAHAP